MTVSSSVRIRDRPKTILHLIGVDSPEWESDRNPLTALNAPLLHEVCRTLKSSKGVYLFPHCLHNKYDKPEGLLILAMDIAGTLYAVGHATYKKGAPVSAQVKETVHTVMQSLRQEGIAVLGFLTVSEPCCSDYLPQLRACHPEDVEGLVEIKPARRIQEDWMNTLSRSKEFRDLAEPVLKVVDILARNPLYCDTITTAAQVNKIELESGCGVSDSDFTILRREELNEENFFEKWFQCGASFFNYFSLFTHMQAHMKTRKSAFRPVDPEGFEYFTSLELRPDTKAFATARSSLLVLSVRRRILTQWNALPEKKKAPAACQRLIAQECASLLLPPSIRTTLAECFTHEMLDDTWGFVPVDEDITVLLYFINYCGDHGFSATMSEESAKNALRKLIPSVKARRKAVVKEFDAFIASFSELAALGFGKVSPGEFWEGEGAKRFPRLAKIASPLLLIPTKLNVVRSLSILRTYASNQFKAFYNDPEALVKAKDAINMSAVDYYSLCDGSADSR